MILSCPACNARFQVRSEMFASGPRKVRCARCGHQWVGEPEPLHDAPSAAEEPATVDAADETSSEVEGSAKRAPFQPLAADSIAGFGGDAEVPPLSEAAKALDRDASRRRTPAWVWVGWFLLVALVGATAAALIFARGPLVAAWPPLERLYASGDVLAQSEPVLPVSFRILESTVTRTDGKNKMVVRLVIENPSSSEAAIPVAALNLIDKSGKVFHTELVRIPGKPLAPGEKRPDSLTLPDVPDRLDRVSMDASEDPEKES